MPTGFDVETGSALSKKLLPLAPRLAKHLKFSRDCGRVTPDKPVTARGLQVIMGNAGYHVHNSEICAMVNHLRRTGHPIASTGRGYFWAVTKDELSSTVQHLHERIAAMRDALHGMERAFSSGQSELPFHT